jgi:hypothetical protein
MSLKRSEEGILQRSRYNNANALGAGELEMGIAHETRDDVLHEGNLEQGPPRHFASAMMHQMRFDVDFGGGMLGICESHLRIHYLPRSTYFSPHRWLLGVGILPGCLLTASFNRVARIHHPRSKRPPSPFLMPFAHSR